MTPLLFSVVWQAQGHKGEEWKLKANETVKDMVLTWSKDEQNKACWRKQFGNDEQSNYPHPQTIKIKQEFTHFTHAINISLKNNAAKL